jgi:hypothetical protein
MRATRWWLLCGTSRLVASTTPAVAQVSDGARETRSHAFVGRADVVLHAVPGAGPSAGIRLHDLPWGDGAQTEARTPGRAPFMWQLTGGVRRVRGR